LSAKISDVGRQLIDGMRNGHCLIGGDLRHEGRQGVMDNNRRDFGLQISEDSDARCRFAKPPLSAAHPAQILRKRLAQMGNSRGAFARLDLSAP
jgi:hypothetical protein